MKILAALIGIFLAQLIGLLVALQDGNLINPYDSAIFGTLIANFFAIITLIYIRYIHLTKEGKKFIFWYLGGIPARIFTFTIIIGLILWLIELKKMPFILSFTFFYGIFMVIEVKFATDLNKSEG